MKVKEYIIKYDLDNKNLNLTVKEIKNNFYSNLLIDFCSLLDLQLFRSNKLTLDLFDKIVDQIEDKFNAISLKARYELSDNLWYDFYDNYIIQTKYHYLPEVKEKEDKIYSMNYNELLEYLSPIFSGLRYSYNANRLHKHYSKEYDKAGYYNKLAFDRFVTLSIKREKIEEKQRQEEEARQYKEYWENRKRMFDAYWNLFAVKSVPSESFSILELAETASLDDVKKQYRTLSMKHHPDRGGNQEMFIKVTDAKNKVIAYLETKNN